MSVLFTAIFSAASIVWDREFGFLREMLVAPVSRSAIVIGKCLGGATVATFQGIVILALAGLAHVPYDPVLFLIIIGELLLLSFTLTAFGVMMAARIKQIQAFMALTQMLVMPLFFLSGALYPLRGLPGWLTVLTRLDPLTYIVYPMRYAVFSHLTLPPAATELLSPSLTWFGWTVPVGLSLGMVALMGAALLTIAILEFQKTRVSRPLQNKKGPRRVATGANHPASHSSALRRGPGTPAVVPRRGTRAPLKIVHRKSPYVSRSKCQLNAGHFPCRLLLPGTSVAFFRSS